MDLRTERTKRSIINAFIELRSRKPIEKITVKELSELAYINKATFYSHYHDIYDLSEQLEEETISSVLKNIPNPNNLIIDPKQGVKELTLALYSQNALFSTLFSGTRASIFSTKLEQSLKQQIFALYPEYENNLEWNVILTVLIQGCFKAFLSYSDNNMDEVIKILGDINECLINNMIPVHS